MNIPLVAGLAAAAGIFIEAVLIYFLLDMFKQVGAVGKNFKQIDIPIGVGISFPITAMLVFTVYAALNYYDTSYDLFLLGIVSISFLGFIDDMLGKRDTRGFRGHFGALLQGRLTTGGLKALGGGFTAFFLAIFNSVGWGELLLNTLVIALFTNMLNLLDLRPGRAIKGYLFFLLTIAVLARGEIDWLLVAPVLGAVIYYLALDIKAKAMMGDAGANVLGLVLGYISITSLSFFIKAGLLLFLIAVHIYTEKYSLTETIEKVPLLRALDKIGRD